MPGEAMPDRLIVMQKRVEPEGYRCHPKKIETREKDKIARLLGIYIVDKPPSVKSQIRCKY